VRGIGQVGVPDVLLGYLGIIDVPAESRSDGPDVGRVAVGRDLWPVQDAGRSIASVVSRK
jgi:hypothetical protein